MDEISGRCTHKGLNQVASLQKRCHILHFCIYIIVIYVY
jgi:hypothetical protein